MSDSAETVSAARGDDRGSTRVSRDRRRPGRLRGIGLFVKQVIAELRKVIWPTRKELVTYTSVVLVFVTVMVLIVSLFDFTFSQLVLAVFGGDPAPTA